MTIRPFLWFQDNAFEAATYYVDMFGGGDINGDAESIVVTFRLRELEVMLLNGGSHYQLSPAFSFFVDCRDQAEVDRYWDRLIGDGGEPSRCGWLTDKYGVSWQIIPQALMRLMSSDDDAQNERVREAMFGMVKLDVSALEAAAAPVNR